MQDRQVFDTKAVTALYLNTGKRMGVQELLTTEAGFVVKDDTGRVFIVPQGVVVCVELTKAAGEKLFGSTNGVHQA